MLNHGIPPVFRDGVHLFIYNVNRHRVSLASLSGHVIAYRWRSLLYRESAGVLMGVPVTGAACSRITVDQSMCTPLFQHPLMYLKKNQSTPRPSEHPPVMGGKMSKRLGGIKGCKYKISSWHLNRFPDADNIGSTV